MASENFSFSMNLSSNRPTGGHSARYLSVPFEARAIHDGQVLLLAAGSSSAQAMPLQAAQALSFCDSLRTLDEHARHAARMMNVAPHQVDGIRQSLGRLVDQGLLLSESSLSATLSASNAGDNPAGPIDTLFIRTCARPDTLERLLESLALAPESEGLERCIVIDDAEDVGDRARTREVIDNCSGRLSCRLRLVDRDDRRRLIARIAQQSGADEGALTWLLEGEASEGQPTYGAGPNLALLLAAGTRFVMMDDDATLDARVPRDAEETPLFSSETDDRVTIPALEDTLPEAAGQPLSGHPVDRHARFLGASTAGLMRRADRDPRAILEKLTPNLLHQLFARPRVKFTCSGVAGDPGTDDVHWLFAGREDSLLGIAAEAAEPGRARLLQRRVVRCPKRAVATSAFALMTTTLTGVDNRELMLPTAARGRNEDMLFGALAGYLYPGSLHLTLPHALFHMRPEPRRWSEDALDKPRFANRARYLFAWLEDLGDMTASHDLEARIEVLRAGLRDLSAQDIDGLKSRLERHTVEIRSTLVERVDRTARALQPPPWLADDFRRVMRACSTTNEATTNALEEVAHSTRQFAGRYAESLASWVDAWRWCRSQDINDLLTE